ncbi:MAG: sporulation protein YabP [Ruminococcaceae bacterium]|nr:sporulation protein YabP [Oscillospiraceae bacterium]
MLKKMRLQICLKQCSKYIIKNHFLKYTLFRRCFFMAEEMQKQNISLESRRKLSITGVKEVENFDDNTITLITDLGTLSVKGSEIKIEKLNLDSGEVSATGDFYAFEYISDENTKRTFFSRMFR